MNEPVTATAVEKMRRWAKQQARDTSIAYGRALEQAARDAGFASWHDVQECVKASTAAAGAGAMDLPVDPALPPNFEQTANEDRPKAELDTWWLRPFVQTRPDGALDVRCLDGGAWDRPTYYGTAKDLAEAREIARAKLESWQEIRDTPAALLLESAYLLVLEPNRPGMQRPVLFAAGSTDDLKRLVARWDETRARDPQAAQLVLRAARERSARVPTYERVESALRRAASAGVVHPDGSPAGIQEVALLLALHAFGEPASAEVQFALTEMAHYLWEFGVDQATIDALFARARQLLVGDRPAIASASKIVRDGTDHWAVRLAPGRWIPVAHS